MRIWLLLFNVIALSWGWRIDARELLLDATFCEARTGRLRDYGVSQKPKRVLIVPLLKKATGSNENERWPERPAAEIEVFYRNAFKAEVVALRDIRVWGDYYRHVQRLQQPLPFFDRVIFIGHGGFDGPSLNYQLVEQSFKVESNVGRLYRAMDAQPGILRELSVNYEINRNPAFHDYVASQWPSLLRLDKDTVETLKELTIQLQPLEPSCYQRHCAPEKLASAPDLRRREIMIKTCDFVCREPLFQFWASDEVSAERFFTFAKSLQALTRPDGLIMVGVCNPGSAATKGPTRWETEGMLVHSTQTGGPYRSYVHLLAAATGRTVAGPVGKTSGADVVKRLRLLEQKRTQRYLCLVPPRTVDGPPTGRSLQDP